MPARVHRRGSTRVGGCSRMVTTASGTSPKPAPDTQAGFPGTNGRLSKLTTPGKETPIRARDADYLMFAPNGQFGATEPVNSHGGLYHQTGDSFTTSDMSSTSVGYTKNDPVALLAIDAIYAFGDGVQAKVQLTGNRLAVTVGGYLLICQRDGRQANFPGPSPAGEAGRASRRREDDPRGRVGAYAPTQKTTGHQGDKHRSTLDDLLPCHTRLE